MASKASDWPSCRTPSSLPCTAYPTSTTDSDWTICHCPNRNWRLPAAVPASTPRPYLLTFDEDGKSTSIHADRYEFWLYRQLRKRLKSGEIYLDDGLQHRCFTDELVSLDEKADVLSQMDISWLRQPINAHLDELTAESREQWLAFNRELRMGKLKHLDYDSEAKTLIWHRPKADNSAAREDAFYEQLSCCDVADVFRFVNEQCGFLSALTPLQPRYAKQIADSDSLMAVIIAQTMNHGNLVMARTSDIPYHVLEATYQQYLRQASLQAANDQISNAGRPPTGSESYSTGNIFPLASKRLKSNVIRHFHCGTRLIVELESPSKLTCFIYRCAMRQFSIKDHHFARSHRNAYSAVCLNCNCRRVANLGVLHGDAVLACDRSESRTYTHCRG